MSLLLDGRLADPARSAAGEACPIERTMSLVGTRSAMVLMREAAYGTTRFDDFVRRTGLTEAVVAGRLRDLVREGLLAREPYRDPGQRARQAYVLTDAGSDLVPALLALAAWGARHRPRRGTPSFRHHECGAPVEPHLVCGEGHEVTAAEVVAGS